MLSDEEILARELAKLGSFGGGSLAGLGGSFGAKFAAKFLPTETKSEKLAIKATPERAIQLGFSALTRLGRLQGGESDGSPYPLLKAVMGSGFLNMNPAVVFLEILEGSSDTCEVTITSAAKEGLIKQHTAEKAIQRIAVRDHQTRRTRRMNVSGALHPKSCVWIATSFGLPPFFRLERNAPGSLSSWRDRPRPSRRCPHST